MSAVGPATIAPAGDSALLVRFPQGPLGEDLLARVLGALAALDADRPAGVVDVMPGYASVLVVLDPARLDPAAARPFVEAALARAQVAAAPAPRPTVEIPVLYAPTVAPDLEALAAEKAITVAELIRRHAAPEYRCHMLGFRPGFPFLGGLDPRLAAPRLATPRPRVASGSVGIGGVQTGVYPSAGPGGWRIVGRTPHALFAPDRDDPFLVHPGDRVRFVPIDEARFAALGGVA